MVHEKTVWVRFLTIFALSVSLWLCIGGRVEAEEESEAKLYVHNHYDNQYGYSDTYMRLYFCDGFEFLQIKYINSETTITPVIYVIEPNFEPNLIFDYEYDVILSDGSIGAGSKSYTQEFTSWNDFGSFVLDDGRVCYYHNFPVTYDEDFRAPGYSVTFNPLNLFVTDANLSSPEIINLYEMGELLPDKQDEHIPIWRTAKNANSSIKLKDFMADLTDDAVVGTWDGIEMGVTKHRNLRSYVNTYVLLTFGLCPIDETDESLEPIYIHYPDGVLGGTPYTMFSNGFNVALSELAIPETHRLWFVQANPYFYENDDINGQLMACNYVQVYFDENGDYLSTETKQPHSEYREEEPEKSIWDAVTDFSTNIGDEIAGVLEYAFIPSGDDVLAVLNEMNDWFSERFGFIWYPFDLAIDLVAAFALGEADSMFTVPALELNMFGGVTLWEEFQTDLDAFGYLHYVRFFTSAILAMSTASLAVHKFDEWIGGKKS